MIDFIYLFLLFSFLGLLLIIFLKIQILMRLPKQPEVTLTPQPFFKKIVHLKASEYFLFLANWTEKNLRKLRIVFLKLDKYIIELIQQIREKSQVFTIRYQAWLDQKKTKRVKIKIKMEDSAQVTAQEEQRIEDKQTEDSLTSISSVSELEAEEKKYIDLLSQNPKDVEAYRNLGNFYLEHQNYKDAVEAFRHVLKLRPRDKGAREKLLKLENRASY